MTRSSPLAASLALAVVAILAQACSINQDDCAKNGQCVKGTLVKDTVPRTTGCVGDAECDDGNRCTRDACTATGECKSVREDRIVEEIGCIQIACRDGMEESAPKQAGASCGDGKS